MEAQDRRFDERREEVVAVLDSTDWQQDQTIYIQAEDSISNWSTTYSTTINIRPESPANWSTFGQNAAHTGYNFRQPAITKHTFGWEIAMSTFFDSYTDQLEQVAVANDIVVANANARFGTGGVVALNARDGTELWRRTFTDKNSINPAAIAYGTVYFQQGNHGGDTFLFALNALTGEQLWQTPFGAQWERYMAPTIAGGRVFINGGYTGGMYAFDAFTGHELWFKGLAQEDQWTPAHHEDIVYSWVHGNFAAWDPQYGTILWSIDMERGHAANRTIAITDTTAFVTTGYQSGALVAVDLQAETEKWRVDGKYSSTPAIADDVVYAINSNQLDAYNVNTQTLVASFNAGEHLVGAPIITAGNVFISSDTQTWCLNRDDLQEVWKINKGGWLTVANNQLFIAQSDGKLTAYNLE